MISMVSTFLVHFALLMNCSETNILISDLRRNDDTLYITDRGRHYFEKLKSICRQGLKLKSI